MNSTVFLDKDRTMANGQKRNIYHRPTYTATGGNGGHQYKITDYVSQKLRSRIPRLTAVGSRCADHASPSTREGWHELRRQAAVARSV
jgi:hypothetical protein